MSRGHLKRGASKQGGAFKARDNKVFDKPEYLLPFRLSIFTNGPGKKRAIQPAPWLRAAVESGLVAMVAPHADLLGGAYLNPIGKKPPARMTRDTLEKLLAEGIANTLIEFDELAREQDAQDKEPK